MPLVLWTLAGWIGPGGWHCASGVPCKPPLAGSCCCGAHDRAPGDCCDDEGSSSHTQLSALPCGCYYQAPALDASQHRPPAPEQVLAALPAGASPRFAPPVRGAFVGRPADLHGPPRLFGSDTVTRGPPAA